MDGLTTLKPLELDHVMNNMGIPGNSLRRFKAGNHFLFKVLILGAFFVILLGMGGGKTSPNSLNGVAIELELVAQGLDQPVGLTHAGDGSGKIYITLQGGKILVFDGTQKRTFLDITSLTKGEREKGLLGTAFHPNYQENGFFYVNYTDLSGATVIARFTRSSDPEIADPDSEKHILTIKQPYGNHNGGNLQFGPDGFLYIGTGDGGSGGDPENRAQNLNELLGKMLRLDVDSSSPYAIPKDNPFQGIQGARPEIWAYGLRNPWRFSFDRKTGDLFIGDVGQSRWEEINFQPSGSRGGENYGWNIMEGNSCFGKSRLNFFNSNCDQQSFTLPILEYSHKQGNCSVTGGKVYRGSKFSELNGIYFYGDFCSGKIWGAVQTNGAQWEAKELLDTEFFLSTFGEDESGDIFVVHHSPGNGAIYRIVLKS